MKHATFGSNRVLQGGAARNRVQAGGIFRFEYFTRPADLYEIRNGNSYRSIDKILSTSSLFLTNPIHPVKFFGDGENKKFDFSEKSRFRLHFNRVSQRFSFEFISRHCPCKSRQTLRCISAAGRFFQNDYPKCTGRSVSPLRRRPGIQAPSRGLPERQPWKRLSVA